MIDHRILCAASDVLDFVTYRPLKLVMVAQLLGVSGADPAAHEVRMPRLEVTLAF